MIKCIALIKRRAGLTHQEFMDYYENRHAPLARRYLSAAVHYERRYLEPDTLGYQAESGVATGMEYFDCMTELWFDDRDTMNRTLAGLADPAVSEMIIADEERFIDRAAIRFFVVEGERTSF